MAYPTSETPLVPGWTTISTDVYLGNRQFALLCHRGMEGYYALWDIKERAGEHLFKGMLGVISTIIKEELGLE